MVGSIEQRIAAREMVVGRQTSSPRGSMAAAPDKLDFLDLSRAASVAKVETDNFFG